MTQKTMTKEPPHSDIVKQRTSRASARSCSMTSSEPAANVMHASAASCTGMSCSRTCSASRPEWLATTPPSMYRVMSGSRVSRLSAGPSRYAATSSTARNKYESCRMPGGVAREQATLPCGVVRLGTSAAQPSAQVLSRG